MGVSPQSLRLLRFDADPDRTELAAELLARIEDRIAVDIATSDHNGHESREGAQPPRHRRHVDNESARRKADRPHLLSDGGEPMDIDAGVEAELTPTSPR